MMNSFEPAIPNLSPVGIDESSKRIIEMLKKSKSDNSRESPISPKRYPYSPILRLESVNSTNVNIHASHDLLKLIQSSKSPATVPFIPHNAFSIDPITGCMVPPVARDLVPQGLPMSKIPHGMWGCIQSSCMQMSPNEDEERQGLSGFDRVLYTRSEQARRVACEWYNSACKQKGSDLVISMPIQVPYGNIVVDVNSGEHYYGVMGNNVSAQHPHSDATLFGRGLIENKTMSHREEDDTDIVIPDFTATPYPSACDVWSSFLRLKLGMIYNVRPDQSRIVTETLKQVMSGVLFESPIEFVANGVFANGADGILQAPPLFSKGVKYVTLLRPKSQIDQDRFILIRQKIKNFANTLGFHFGGSIGGASYSSPTFEYQPLIGVELDANLSSQRITNGLMQVEIRSYDSEDIAESLKDKIWEPHPNQLGFYRNATKDKIVSRVECSEVRLEHDRGHSVDPRWQKDLVIARRISSFDSTEEFQQVERFARHVFCSYPSPQTIVYRGKFKDLKPGCEPVYTSDLKLSTSEIKNRLCKSRFKREFTNYIKCQPQAASNQFSEISNSPVLAPLPKPYVPSPISKPSVSSSNWNVNASVFQPSHFEKSKDQSKPSRSPASPKKFKGKRLDKKTQAAN